MMLRWLATCAILLLTAATPRAGERETIDFPPRVQKLPRKVYAHYMGCFPIGTKATAHVRKNMHDTMDPHSKDLVKRYGGQIRNYPLIPPDMFLNLEESADLELRRAVRMGLDGFAIDAWAGGEDAKEFLDVLFKVAEEKDYPVELTICCDANCGGGGWNTVPTVKWLLDRHGESPKLARRDGKPLLFGYQSVWGWHVYLLSQLRKGLSEDEVKARMNELRTSPEGWEQVGSAYKSFEEQIGRPIYWHFGIGAFFFNVEPKMSKDEMLEALPYIARSGIPAIGSFTNGDVPKGAAEAINKAGAEWCQPIMYQYENIHSRFWYGGPEWLRGVWGGAIRNSKLLQITTWNDYNENTVHAPAYNTRYTIYDLTRHYIQWWKSGAEPTCERDRIYLFHKKYGPEARVYPFQAYRKPWRSIEVHTILTEPGTLRLVGRKDKDGKPAQWEAPAGFHRWSGAPFTPGPVVVELLRGGKVVQKLESPEPITDKPFRHDTGIVGISTEFMHHWEADFGKDVKPFYYSEYSDMDDDGLPNWFEMLWFGKFGDWSTATKADPNDDPDEDGKTNLEEWREQTNPTLPPRDMMKVDLLEGGDGEDGLELDLE